MPEPSTTAAVAFGLAWTGFLAGLALVGRPRLRSARPPADAALAALVPAAGLAFLAAWRPLEGLPWADWGVFPTAATSDAVLYLTDVGRPSLVGNALLLLARRAGGLALVAAVHAAAYTAFALGAWAAVRRRTDPLTALLVAVALAWDPLVLGQVSTIGAYATHLGAAGLGAAAVLGPRGPGQDARVWLAFALAALDMPHAGVVLAGWTLGRLLEEGRAVRRLVAATAVLGLALVPAVLQGLARHGAAPAVAASERLPVPTPVLLGGLALLVAAGLRRERPAVTGAALAGLLGALALDLARPEVPRQLLFVAPLGLAVALGTLARAAAPLPAALAAALIGATLPVHLLPLRRDLARPALLAALALPGLAALRLPVLRPVAAAVLLAAWVLGWGDPLRFELRVARDHADAVQTLLADRSEPIGVPEIAWPFAAGLVGDPFPGAPWTLERAEDDRAAPGLVRLKTGRCAAGRVLETRHARIPPRCGCSEERRAGEEAAVAHLLRCPAPRP